MSSYVMSGAPEQLMLTRGSFLPLAAVTKASLSLGGATLDVTDNSAAATFSAPVTLPQGAALLVVTTFGILTAAVTKSSGTGADAPFSASPSFATFSAPTTVQPGAELQFTTGQPGVDYEVAFMATATLQVYTAAVIAGSNAATLSAAETLPAGTAVVFSDQPSTVYYLANSVTGGTAIFLTEPYDGVSDAAATVTTLSNNTPGAGAVAVLTTAYTGTTEAADTPNGSDLVTLAAPIVAGTAATFEEPFPGVTDAAATVTNATPVATSPINANPELVTRTGQNVRCVAKAFGAYAAGDYVLIVPQPDIFQCVGSD